MVELNKKQRSKILAGYVCDRGSWKTIGEKASRLRQYRSLIHHGYVYFRGSWLTMQQKARIIQNKVPVQDVTVSYIYSENKKTTTYQRTLHHLYLQDEPTLKTKTPPALQIQIEGTQKPVRPFDKQ